jgi:RNA 3'-terminal phosphate cyclase
MFARGATTLRISGGTDTRWSIPVDYFTSLILPVFRRLGRIEAVVTQRGFYPKGQGVLELKIRPELPPIAARDAGVWQGEVRRMLPMLDLGARRKPKAIKGISAASEFLSKARVAERQAESAGGVLGTGLPVEIRTEYCRTASAGTVITLWTVDEEGRSLLGADALGEKGKPAEDVGREAAHKLMETLHAEAAVDVHLADNLVPLLAVVGGKIRTARITDHMRANIHVCEIFLDVRFKVDEASALVEVK